MKQKTLFLLLNLILAGSMSGQQKKWTLRESVDYALQHNISIRQSELDADEAAIDRSDAIGAFLPTANFSASHSWSVGLNQNITTGLLENMTTQYTSAGLNSNIDIYKGLQNLNRLRRAKLAGLAGQYKLTKMKDDISLNVANAFLQIIFNKENLKVQKEQLLNNEKQMQRTDELVKAGSVPRGDLLDMQATVASNRQAVVVAENTLLISRLSLAQLLQIDDFENFDIEDRDYQVAESPTMLQTPQAIYDKARQERVEIKIAQTNLEIAEKDVRIARGAYHPRLSGFYSFDTRAVWLQDISNPSLFDQFSDNKGHNFGFQLVIPILNGFSTRNNVKRSVINRERFKVAYDQAQLDLERNVYQAFADAKGALNAYEASVAALEARTEAYNYAKEKFNVGMMNAFDLNQAQTLFVNAQSDVLRTKYDYIFRVKVVEFYFGIPIMMQN